MEYTADRCKVYPLASEEVWLTHVVLTMETSSSLFACGLSSFGQFAFVKGHCSLLDVPITIHSPVTDSVNVVHCKIVDLATNHPVIIQSSFTWDASLIRMKTSDWTVCLISTKLASSIGNDIVKIWETNSGMLIKYVNGSILFKTGGMDTPISADIDQFCSLTEGLSYALLSDGKLCQCEFKPFNLCPVFPTYCVKEIANGTDHVLLITDNGCLYSFGIGTRGQLGQGDLLSKKQPSLIEALAGIKVTSISCGNWHSMALTEHKDIYSWGMNDCGQLGHSPIEETICPLPKLVTITNNEDTNYIAISCGSKHSAACTEQDHTLHVWGWDKYGQVFDEKIQNIKYFTCGPWCTIYLK